MKMDPELLRLLLLEIEKHEEPFAASEVEIDGYDSERIAYHAALLHDAGFLVGAEHHTVRGMNFVVQRMTFSGHEFLEAVRRRSVWRLTRDRMERDGAGFVLDIARDLALAMLRQQVGL